MYFKIQLRRDSNANWYALDPILAEGEVGVDLDLGSFKIGDGVTTWANLSSFTPSAPNDSDWTLRQIPDSDWILRQLIDSEWILRHTTKVDSDWVLRQIPDSDWILRQFPDSDWVLRQIPDSDWVLRQFPDSEWVLKQFPDSEWVLKQIPDSDWIIRQIPDSEWILRHILESDMIVRSIRFDEDDSETSKLMWNFDDGTLDIYTGFADVVIQSGQEMVYVIRNTDASPILNGTPVSFTGVVTGAGRVSAAPAVGSDDTLKFLGLATHDIASGNDGLVTRFGYIRHLDTTGDSDCPISIGGEAWGEGDILWLHPGSTGKLTKVEPAGDKIAVATVIRSQQSAGILFVNPRTISGATGFDSDWIERRIKASSDSDRAAMSFGEDGVSKRTLNIAAGVKEKAQDLGTDPATQLDLTVAQNLYMTDSNVSSWSLNLNVDSDLDVNESVVFTVIIRNTLSCQLPNFSINGISATNVRWLGNFVPSLTDNAVDVLNITVLRIATGSGIASFITLLSLSSF